MMRREQVLQLLVHATIQDGKVDPMQDGMLPVCARRLGIQQEQLLGMIQQAQEGKRVQVVLPTDTQARAELWNTIVDVVCVEGVVHEPEKAFLARHAPRFDVTNDSLEKTIDAAIARVKSRRVARARAKIQKSEMAQSEPEKRKPITRAGKVVRAAGVVVSVFFFFLYLLVGVIATRGTFPVGELRRVIDYGVLFSTALSLLGLVGRWRWGAWFAGVFMSLMGLLGITAFFPDSGSSHLERGEIVIGVMSLILAACGIPLLIFVAGKKG